MLAAAPFLYTFADWKNHGLIGQMYFHLPREVFCSSAYREAGTGQPESWKL